MKHSKTTSTYDNEGAHIKMQQKTGDFGLLEIALRQAWYSKANTGSKAIKVHQQKKANKTPPPSQCHATGID